ncbi:hypothetical protein [Dactylosporangium sp. CA-233914]|uniref:hypothetical protein n=1 Tax=Dactylosporangium sp. CA-233914 TaxID=3239934 RepID=UPI003D8FF1FC
MIILPTVIETSAIYVATRIPDRSPALRSAFAEVLLPRVALADIDAGRREFVRSPGSFYTVAYDAANDVLVRHEPTSAEHQQLRQCAIALDEPARDLTIVDLAAASAPADAGLWYAPIAVAEQRSLPLWSDNIAIRAFAAAQDVEAFGTFALITALIDAELSVDALRQDALILAGTNVVDLVLTPQELCDLAESRGWAARSVALYSSRADAWTNPAEATETLLTILSHVAREARESLLTWVQAARVGLSVGRAAGDASQFARNLVEVIADRIDADAATGSALNDTAARTCPLPRDCG